jgi:hypothetical protein
MKNTSEKIKIGGLTSLFPGGINEQMQRNKSQMGQDYSAWRMTYRIYS